MSKRSEAWHRHIVGGLWEELGALQFEYLVSSGLRPEHYFLDIGCGSFRGGRHFIPYLEPGRYFGVDRNAEPLRVGQEQELDAATVEGRDRP
jgi:SAM-dependent methyltransferase